MPIEIIASDNKEFKRGRAGNTFRACIGTTISFENPDRFESRYKNFFEELKEEYSIDNPRYVFKSYDLKSIFPFDEYIEIVERFVDELINSSIHVNFVFASFNTQKMPEVRYLTKNMPALKFLRKLNDYFTYISAWKVVKEANLKLVEAYMDSFNEVEKTRAWDEINRNGNTVKIFPKGDQCITFIATADIFLDYIDNLMKKRNIRLDMGKVHDLLSDIGIEKASVFYCGNREIYDIVPDKETKIPPKENYVVPVVRVIKEGIIDKEKDWIEKSPSKIHQYLLRYASDLKGGLEYIDFSKDARKINEGDHLVYLGPNGERIAKYLEKLGYVVNISSIDEVIEKYK